MLVLHFCVELRYAWAGEPRFKMNQLISKSTGEDINTNLLAVISTRESDTSAMVLQWPTSDSDDSEKGKGAAHLKQLPFHKQCYHGQTL